MTTNYKRNSVSMKGVIVHRKKSDDDKDKKYMHIWNECMVMIKILVEILVIVCNWPIEFLDSGATCHMTPQVSDCIPGSFENTDQYIEIADEHYVTAKQKGKF